MKALVFHGIIKTGKGEHSQLVIPGRKALNNAPSDWPGKLQPGSLNILIADDGYPSEFSKLCPDEKVKNLDSKQFPPTFTIPHDHMTNNSLKPCSKMPDKGTAQVWRSTLRVKLNSTTLPVWVHRRIGSGVRKQLELVSEIHLRKELKLIDGMEVTVELQYL